MSCSSSEALFEDYLDGALAPAQRARLLTHLAGCGPCKGMLAELRVVDALISAPRHVTLPENFTFATMAEVRSLPRPHGTSAPVYAYLVSYLAASWLLIGAGFLFASAMMRTLGQAAVDLSASLARVFAVVGLAGTRAAGDFAPLGTLLGGVIITDVAIALVLIVGFAVVRPRLAAWIRS